MRAALPGKAEARRGSSMELPSIQPCADVLEGGLERAAYCL